MVSARTTRTSAGHVELLFKQSSWVDVAIEACRTSGHARWFERPLAELHFELWIGDAAEIRTNRKCKQKTGRQDAQLLLRLLLKDAFRGSGYRAGRIETCGNYCGTGTGWCRCARD